MTRRPQILACAALLLPGLMLPLAATANPLALPAAPAAPAPPLATVAAPVQPVEAGAPKPAAELSETQRYCQNIAAAAADARFAWQRKQLSELDAKLKQRIADLEAREAALKDSLARRDDLVRRANETVVGIYAHMKPEAAAQQIAALDDEMATSILVQLTQKQASTILNEVPAERAAKLIAAITTVVPPQEKKS